MGINKLLTRKVHREGYKVPSNDHSVLICLLALYLTRGSPTKVCVLLLFEEAKYEFFAAQSFTVVVVVYGVRTFNFAFSRADSTDNYDDYSFWGDTKQLSEL